MNCSWPKLLQKMIWQPASMHSWMAVVQEASSPTLRLTTSWVSSSRPQAAKASSMPTMWL